DGSAFRQRRNDLDIVNDFLAHVYRCTELVERLFDRNNRAVNSGAVSARRGEKNLFRGAAENLNQWGIPDGMSLAQLNIDFAVRHCAHDYSLRFS
ncbi:MAG: hypothetical protein RLZZ441_951, partial [Actinomycetota bacterium]